MTDTAKCSTDNPFHPEQWKTVAGLEDLTDITYHHHVGEGRENSIVRITFDHPGVRNTLRSRTVDELYYALDHACRTPDIGVVLLTGNDPNTKDGGRAFCSGDNQRTRGHSGYQYATSYEYDDATIDASIIDTTRAKVKGGRLHILKV